MSNLLFALALMMAAPKPPVLSSENADQCFLDSVCSLKEAIRWQTPKWTAPMCTRVGKLILEKERETGIPRNLILSVMVNESDMNENAQRFTYDKATRTLLAWDGGLMGLRCKIDKDGKSCKNYRGRVTYKDLLNPKVNIDKAVAKLQATKAYPCAHSDHPWFAHYNWGGKVFRDGIARSYPQRIAVLWKALNTAQGIYHPELDTLKFVQVAGKKKVTIDTPVGWRHKELVAKIWASRCQTCGTLTSTLPFPAVLATQ